MNNTLPVPATTRPIKLHEVVLIVLSRRPPAEDTGVTAEELTLILMHEPLASSPNMPIGVNSIYASMSGMQTQPRKWIEPCDTYTSKVDGSVHPKRGRNAHYRITEAGRSRARWLIAELETAK